MPVIGGEDVEVHLLPVPAGVVELVRVRVDVVHPVIVCIVREAGPATALFGKHSARGAREECGKCG